MLELAIFLFQAPEASLNPGQGQDKVKTKSTSEQVAGSDMARTMDRPAPGHPAGRQVFLSIHGQYYTTIPPFQLPKQMAYFTHSTILTEREPEALLPPSRNKKRT
jgi:hypothetical protein